MSYPISSIEAETHMIEFTNAGLNGAFGSMDAAHVIVENVRIGLSRIIRVVSHN